MGDLPPSPLAAARSKDEQALYDPGQLAAPYQDSDKIGISPCPTPTEHVEPQLGPGSAMFSTALGTRAPRKLQGPPYTPVIVRSNMLLDVVNAAGFWRTKYPYQYLCIFPYAGWQIEDLWDEEDIHLETESFCKQLLQFIERDNAVRAQKYAYDWSKKYPERLPIVGGEMTGLYEKDDPLSIVDKIFVNDESREYPSIFLWHVAHIMRTAMLAVKGVMLPLKTTVTRSVRLSNDDEDSVLHSTTRTPQTPTSTATAIVSTAPASTMDVPTHEVGSAFTMPDAQPKYVQQNIRKPPPAQGHALDLTAGSSYPWTPEYGVPSGPGQHMGGSDAVNPALRVHKTRAGRSASGTYNQNMAYTENLPRVPSGLGPRQHTGPPAMMHSPRYNQARMMMTQPMGNVHPGTVPVPYEQLSMPSGMIAGPPHSHHGVVHPSMIPPQAMRTPSMTHGYPRQLSGPQGVPYTAAMGDITNMPYTMGIPPQQFGSPHPSEGRFVQQYTNASALYDPYEGNNPAFRVAGYCNINNKRNSQTVFNNSSSRQRKTSLPGGRPSQGQYVNDRHGLPQMGSKRPPQLLKTNLENDLAITQDQEYGCYENWIGPQNENVNELYVKDLPDDIEAAELEAMFHEELRVKPTSINIKSSHYVGRKHAFVGFSSASIAKKGIALRNATIRGLPVSITVPRRFFQKTVEIAPRKMFEAGPSSYSRFTANPNNSEHRPRGTSLSGEDGGTSSTAVVNDSTSYSPQDARSDVHKKKKGKQPQQGATTTGSPEARKSKPKKQRESPVQVETTGAMSAGVKQQDDKADGHVIASDATSTSVSIEDDRRQQIQVTEMTPSDRAESTLAAGTEERHTLNTAASTMEVPDAIKSTSSTSSGQQQSATIEQLDSLSQHIDESGIEEKLAQQKPGSPENNRGGQASVAQDLVPMVPMVPLVPEVKMHEGNLKHDLIFHSSVESQADIPAERRPSTGSGLPNQGTASFASRAIATANKAPSTLSNLSNKTAIADSTITSEHTVISPAAVVATSDPLATATQTEAMAPSKPQAGELSKYAAKDEMPSTSVSVVFEPVKKTGAQHTESLHPFSKAAKAQAKKDREQKKKAQKKEKEQAEKAKAAKPVDKVAVKTSAESDGTTKTASNSGQISDANLAAHGDVSGKGTHLTSDKKGSTSNGGAFPANASTEKVIPAVVASDAADDRNKRGQRKGKNSNTPSTQDTVTAEKDDEDHGKQTGGNVSIPNEISSVTNKEVKVNLPEDAPGSDVQSPRPEYGNEASSTTKEPVPTVKFADGPAPAVRKKKNKAKKKNKVPAWPNLDFRPKTTNPTWMGPIDMANDIQHYDEIMNTACGGEDDSDFSWSDLPLVEEEMDYDEEDLDEGKGKEDDGRALDAIKTRIAELQVQEGLPEHSQDPANNAVRAEAVPISKTTQKHVVDSAIATLELQIAATHEEIDATNANIVQLTKRADTHAASSTAAPAAKKKKNKPNNRKNKKKKAAENAETPEGAQAEGAVGANETPGSTSNVDVEDLIDSNDPFYDQLKEIEDTKRGNQETPILRGGHAKAAKTCDEPQLMRTMEAYFKETQGSGQSSGRKASQKDLQG